MILNKKVLFVTLFALCSGTGAYGMQEAAMGVVENGGGDNAANIAMGILAGTVVVGEIVYEVSNAATTANTAAAAKAAAGTTLKAVAAKTTVAGATKVGAAAVGKFTLSALLAKGALATSWVPPVAFTLAGLSFIALLTTSGGPRVYADQATRRKCGWG